LFKLILLFAIIPAVIISHNKFLRINHIVCNVNLGNCPLEVVEILSPYLSRSALFLNQNQLISKIQTIIDSEKISISLWPPNTLNLSLVVSGFQIPVDFVSASTPQFIFDSSLANQLYGYIASASAQRRLLLPNGQLIIRGNDKLPLKPQIVIVSGLSPELLTTSLNQLKNFVSERLDFDLAFIYPNLDSALIILRLEGNSELLLIIDINKDIHNISQTLQQITRQATIDSVSLIDLRFNKPIIK